MTAAPQPQTRQQHPDGIKLLARFGASMDALFERATLGAGDAHSIHRLLLTLELRYKLEEQLLFPELYEVHGHDRRCFDDAERSLRSLRELADDIRGHDHDPARQQLLLAALEGVAVLHFAEVGQLLASDADQLDRRALGSQVQAMLQRWQQELQQTGDIEDEEADPVGLPPR